MVHYIDLAKICKSSMCLFVYWDAKEFCYIMVDKEIGFVDIFMMLWLFLWYIVFWAKRFLKGILDECINQEDLAISLKITTYWNYKQHYGQWVYIFSSLLI